MGNVEFLARTTDTPRFNFGIIEMSLGRGMEQHVHEDEDDSFYIFDGEMTFFFGEEKALATPGTFLLVPPGRPTASRTRATCLRVCSTSTRPSASTGV